MLPIEVEDLSEQKSFRNGRGIQAPMLVLLLWISAFHTFLLLLFLRGSVFCVVEHADGDLTLLMLQVRPSVAEYHQIRICIDGDAFPAQTLHFIADRRPAVEPRWILPARYGPAA